METPHIAPLSAYVSALRDTRPGYEFPDFDPLDGGVEADILFLFEKPGPMTSPAHKRMGSGFISRDNDDPTAEAVFWFMREIGLDRGRTVLWNTVPGWNGTRAITGEELQWGLRTLESLLSLLPRVRIVILVGKKAARAEPALSARGISILVSAHPSPLVRARWPARWRDIPQCWKGAL